MYQRKVDVNILNAVKNMLADVSSVNLSSEQRANVDTLYVIHTYILLPRYCIVFLLLTLFSSYKKIIK